MGVDACRIEGKYKTGGRRCAAGRGGGGRCGRGGVGGGLGSVQGSRLPLGFFGWRGLCCCVGGEYRPRRYALPPAGRCGGAGGTISRASRIYPLGVLSVTIRSCLIVA